MPDFLLEIGVEEIPARMIDAAAEELGQRVAKLFADHRLDSGTAIVPSSLATPRRLR